MKSNVFLLILGLGCAINQSSANGAAAAGASTGAGVQSGSSSAGASGNAAFGTPPASGNASVSGNVGVNNPPPVPPQTPNPLLVATNNLFVGQTNSTGTNQTGDTNQVNVTNQFFNTNQVFVTNQMFSTNFVSITNRTGLAPNDMAASEFDRVLIVEVRQRLYLKDPGTSGSWSTVGLASQGGNMLVSGQVAQLADKQNLIVLVRNTPGVIAVADHVLVNPALTNSASANGTISRYLNPASDPSLGDSYRFSTTMTNRFVQRVFIPPARGTIIATNLTPTGSTNPGSSNTVLEGVVGTNVITVPADTNTTNTTSP